MQDTMASSNPPLELGSTERRLINVNDFKDYEQHRDVADGLIKAHKETYVNSLGWSRADDVELKVYIDHRLYRPYPQLTDMGHPLCRRVDFGPQYLTRAAMLFLNTVLVNKFHPLSLFEKAVRDFGFAAPVPTGLFYLTDTQPKQLVLAKRVAPVGWMGGWRLTSIYSYCIHPFRPSASQQNEHVHFRATFKREPYTGHGRNVEPTGSTATKRTLPQLAVDELVIYESKAPVKRPSLHGEERFTVGRATKKSKLDVSALSDSGEGSPPPDIKGANEIPIRLKELEQAVAHLQLDANKVGTTLETLHESPRAVSHGTEDHLDRSQQESAKEISNLKHRMAAVEKKVEEILAPMATLQGKVDKLNDGLVETQALYKNLLQALKQNGTIG
jgi:hypothetical protein